MLKNVVCTLTLLAFYVGGTAVFAQAPAKKAAPVVYCAVTDEKIGDAKNASATKIVAGKKYYLCCPGCAPKFDAAPAKYAKIADLRTEKRTLSAKLVKVNAELKKAEVAPSAAAMPKAETSVVASASLHCAITDEAIASAKDAAGSGSYGGKTYYFCCPGCVTKFNADPAKYAAEADKRNATRVN